MLKNFENGYLVSGSSEIAKTEKNDCAVRAIANACEVNYNQAHKFVNDNFNRKKGKFILTVKGHALAVKNGIIVDNKNYQMGGYRRVVEAAYQVK